MAPAFPRRGRQIELRLYLAGQTAPVAALRVPTPAPENQPTWTPGPATRSSGGLTVTLTGLVTGHVAPESAPADRAGRNWTRARFRVQENGRPTDRWEPISAVLSDATGNVLTPPATNRPTATGEVVDSEWVLHRRAGGEVELAFEGNLPAREAAGKLRVEFAPTRSFSTAELIGLRGVSVPARSTTLHPMRGNRPGPAGVDAEVERVPGARAGALSVAVRLWSPKDGSRVGLVRAVDDRGRELALEEPGVQFLPPRPWAAAMEYAGYRRWGGEMSGTVTPMPAPYVSRFYTVNGAPGARSLDLTFARVASRFVEFVAQPSWSSRSEGK